MTRRQFAIGSATCIVVTIAAWLSISRSNDHFATVEASRRTANKSSGLSNINVALRAPGACVDKDGAWRNWSWANVPMLSPQCGEDR